jgi:hypothetical protein
LTAHRSDPACAGCHVITDPIGLSLERFDGIGSSRKTENGAVIDTTASVDDHDVDGAIGLGKALAASPATTACVADRALEYAIGRSTEDAGASLSSINQDFAASQYRITALFFRVATMPATYRLPPAPSATTGAMP